LPPNARRCPQVAACSGLDAPGAGPWVGVSRRRTLPKRRIGPLRLPCQQRIQRHTRLDAAGPAPVDEQGQLDVRLAALNLGHERLPQLKPFGQPHLRQRSPLAHRHHCRLQGLVARMME